MVTLSFEETNMLYKFYKIARWEAKCLPVKYLMNLVRINVSTVILPATFMGEPTRRTGLKLYLRDSTHGLGNYIVLLVNLKEIDVSILINAGVEIEREFRPKYLEAYSQAMCGETSYIRFDQ